MAKRCPNCKAEISRYQAFCYQCGQEIKKTSKRPKHGWKIHWLYFLLGLAIPPLGFGYFFFMMRERYEEAKSAMIGAIISIMIWFIWSQIYYYFLLPDTEAEWISWFFR